MVERTPSSVHYKPNKIKDMEEFIAVKETKVRGNDCIFCVLKDKCNVPCDLPHGFHYEMVFLK